MSEADYRVELSEEDAGCVDPGGRRNAVAWAALESVRVVTTGAGPFAPDVFWVLEGGGARCVVPLGASGEPELLERLQALPGFDNEAFIKAMGSSEDASFPVWRREGAARAVPARRAGLSGAEKLALATAGLGLLHHADHVLRFDHSGWPFRPEVTSFTWSLLLFYTAVALLLAFRGWPHVRVWKAFLLFFVPTFDYLLETPADQYRTWAERPDVNLLHVASPALGIAAAAVSVLLTLAALATLVAFWRETARR